MSFSNSVAGGTGPVRKPSRRYSSVPLACSRLRLMEDQGGHSDSDERRVRLPKSLSGERRACTRYPLTLDLHYTVFYGRKLRETGTGRVVNVSSSGLRFTTDRPLSSGQKIELFIRWPLLLDGSVQIQLVLVGTIVWGTSTEAAMQIQRHEFRTRGAGTSFSSSR